MKRLFAYIAVLALAAAPAFAAKNAEKVNISAPVTVGTTQLPAATYKVTWTATGNNAQVTFDNGKSVVTLPAKLVDQKNQQNSVITQAKGGATILEGINLKTVTLTFTASPSSGQ